MIAKTRSLAPLVASLFMLATSCRTAPSTDTLSTSAPLAALTSAPSAAPWTAPGTFEAERISTAVPFPRGLELVDGKLFSLCRGRGREAGGVSATVDDQAGTIYEIDPAIAEPATSKEIGARVTANGRVLARPTEPPFHLWRKDADPPTSDHETDRPYCALRWGASTKSFYICAFSGIDKLESDAVNFSKNLNDGLLRFDLRTSTWNVVERHRIEAGGTYPHHDPATAKPPHGWLNGPDNCLAVGNSLYAVAKDNSCLVRYDLAALIADPNAGPPPGERILGDHIAIEGLGEQTFQGHSALAISGSWLYLAFRTSSEVIRIRLGPEGLPLQPIVGQLVARFKPYDPKTKKSANLTDIACDGEGRLYVLSAKPACVHRFVPDPHQVYDARGDERTPWLDAAGLLGNAAMKSENLLVDAGGRVYLTSGDAYQANAGTAGAIYRFTPTGGSGPSHPREQ